MIWTVKCHNINDASQTFNDELERMGEAFTMTSELDAIKSKCRSAICWYWVPKRPHFHAATGAAPYWSCLLLFHSLRNATGFEKKSCSFGFS
ncbi:hypothetical protein CHUAL_003830 [Chamberlinius hualienensis]